MTLPAPKLMPPLEAAPDWTISVLAPMLAMLFCMAAFEPWPISIMAMTAADGDDHAQGTQGGPHLVPPQGVHGRDERAGHQRRQRSAAAAGRDA